MDINEKVESFGKKVRELQNLIFDIGYFGQVVLANGHIYEITEDDRSFHSFRAIKRQNPSIELGLTDEVMCYISKGADPALLLEFISDFATSSNPFFKATSIA